MPRSRQSWKPLAACLVGLVFLACEQPGPTDPADLAFHHNPGHGGGKGGPGGGNGDDGGGDGGTGDGSVTVVLSGAAVGTHAGKNVRENNRRLEIGGGPQAATAFGFSPATACEARHGGHDGPLLEDDAMVAYLTSFLTANLTAGVNMSYDKRSNGAASSDHDLAFHFTDDAGRGVNVAIFAHGNPPPTITRDADTFTVTGGVLRVWLRDGPPKNHPKLFCHDHGNTVVLTLN